MKGFKWPDGNYGVLSYAKCPQHWYEFTHCMDNEDFDNRDDIKSFKLGLGNLCTESSVTFRYCFKGKRVPSREGGFWTSSQSNLFAYVIKGVGSNCRLIGKQGGTIYIDNENDYNRNSFGNDGLNGKTFKGYQPDDFDFGTNTLLSFCKIGEKRPSGSLKYIEVGHFNKQKFGFFISPGNLCPQVISPYGVMNGERQSFYIDDQDGDNRNKVIKGNPPVTIEDGNSRWAVCQYDPGNLKAIKLVVAGKL